MWTGQWHVMFYIFHWNHELSDRNMSPTIHLLHDLWNTKDHNRSKVADVQTANLFLTVSVCFNIIVPEDFSLEEKNKQECSMCLIKTWCYATYSRLASLRFMLISIPPFYVWGTDMLPFYVKIRWVGEGYFKILQKKVKPNFTNEY